MSEEERGKAFMALHKEAWPAPRGRPAENKDGLLAGLQCRDDPRIEVAHKKLQHAINDSTPVVLDYFRTPARTPDGIAGVL